METDVWFALIKWCLAAGILLTMGYFRFDRDGKEEEGWKFYTLHIVGILLFSGVLYLLATHYGRIALWRTLSLLVLPAIYIAVVLLEPRKRDSGTLSHSAQENTNFFYARRDQLFL